MDTHDEREKPDREKADEGLRILARIIARQHRRNTGEDAPSQETNQGVSSNGARNHGKGDNDDKTR